MRKNLQTKLNKLGRMTFSVGVFVVGLSPFTGFPDLVENQFKNRKIIEGIMQKTKPATEFKYVIEDCVLDEYRVGNGNTSLSYDEHNCALNALGLDKENYNFPKKTITKELQDKYVSLALSQ